MTRKKPGRNEPCWCGSGKKYKKCHLGRENQKPIEPWEAFKKFREKFSFGVCLSPSNLHGECSEKIIKAHTVPKSSSLKAIAVNGHVYGFIPSLKSIQKHQGRLKPELIGVNQASTFTGFCKLHDDKIFAPLEKQTFKASPEQCFLLTYRAFSRECYTKSAMANLHELRASLDKGKPIETQMFIQMINSFVHLGASAGVNDNEFYKRKLDEALESSNFDSSQAVVFEFKNPPPVMVSGAVYPDFDFNGKRIQDLNNLKVVPNMMAMNSFYDGQKGYMVMSWQAYSSEVPKMLVQSLLEKSSSDYEKYLLQYIFKSFENCFIAPCWWDAIEESDKEILINLMVDSANPLSEPNGDGIASVQLKAAFPTIQEIHHINWEPVIRI